MTTDPTPAIEVWARMLCAADAHVRGAPPWQHLGADRRDAYRAVARWLLPRMTIQPPRPILACAGCGEMCSMAAPCRCWIRLDTLPLADIKALLAADGELSVDPGPADSGEADSDA